jgi:chromatin remodeling complex protein RSC6
MAKSTSNTKSKKTANTELSSTEAPVQTQEVVESVQVAAPAQVVASVSVQENVSSSTEVAEQVLEESSTELLFNKAINQFQDIQNAMKTLHSNLKVLQKEILKERKESKKKESKIKKKSDKKKSPSGFAKPSPISSDLASFLGLSVSEQIARTDVTSKVIAYVKAHNLQNPENKKQILPDAKLGAILQSGNDVVTFFNLQTYLKKHFLANTTVEQSTVSATVV